MKTFYLLIALFLCEYSFSQDIVQQLDKSIKSLYNDPQFKNSLLGMYVVDARSGKAVYQLNSDVGLVPASCQKVITSASAFELLGQDYHYKTEISYSPQASNHSTALYFKGSGDPTIGSSRFASTTEAFFLQQLSIHLAEAGIRTVDSILFVPTDFSSQVIPDGWVWQDVGNYFGAGASYLNWKENKYDIILEAGKTAGEATTIKTIVPSYINGHIINECITGPAKSGDNAYIYHALDGGPGFIRGTIPATEDNFSISGAVADPVIYFKDAIRYFLLANNIYKENSDKRNEGIRKALYTYSSPGLDSMNYWFLKKSINLYGEAFVKTIALEKAKHGTTDTGINIIRNFWAGNGIAKSSIKIIDGSGLSPSNRVSSRALVQVLQFAKDRPWFGAFYDALPEMNGIKMKDGYIGGVRSYCGYTGSSAGKGYIFAFIVNNFDGDPKSAREKMWKVLDILK